MYFYDVSMKSQMTLMPSMNQVHLIQRKPNEVFIIIMSPFLSIHPNTGFSNSMYIMY